MLELTPNDLYTHLEKIARFAERQNPSPIKSKLMTFLVEIISIEEETNFRRVVQNIFDKYKSYKSTFKAEKGCCEICGGSTTVKMQPDLRFSRKGQAFSQIKSKYDYRSICYLCIYDHLVLRKGLRQGQVRTFLTLTTPIPDILNQYKSYKRLKTRILQGTMFPTGIRKMMEREESEIFPMPVPERIEIPVGKEKSYVESENVITATDNGIIFKLQDLPQKHYSVKEARARYEPLYHIMKFLGFKVSIGSEEQDNLIGISVESTISQYYKSLAVILFAYCIKNSKKSKRFYYAKRVIQHSPNITLVKIKDAVENKKIKGDLVKCLIRSLMKSKIIISH